MSLSPRQRPCKNDPVAEQAEDPSAEERKKRGKFSLGRGLAKAFLLFVGTVVLASFLSSGAAFSSKGQLRSVASAPVFTCPVEQVAEGKNYAGTWAEDTYKAATKKIQRNATSFLDNLDNKAFDAWGVTYKQFKKAYYPWKAKYFAPYLKSGSSIYESASGVGLQLLLSLEIVQQNIPEPIDNVKVYGNEFLASTALLSREILDARLPLLQNISATQGALCPGDSVNLSFVPSNSMDLVYTGYVTPLFDPLDRQKGKNYYLALCSSAAQNNETAVQLVTKMQEAQNNWYSLWVKEMIRIAKPGAPVIIEQASFSLCQEKTDYGGVSQDFWQTAVAKFQWDVDPSSLVIESEPLFQRDFQRVNVFMKKKDSRRRSGETTQLS